MSKERVSRGSADRSASFMGLGALAAAHGKEYGLFAGKAGKVQPSLPVAAVKLGPYGGAGMDALCADVF